MRTAWEERGEDKSVTSPVSLIVTGFSPVRNVSKTLTPQLNLKEDTRLILISLGDGPRLGGSALAQAYNRGGGETPDVEASRLSRFFNQLTKLKQAGKVLAYHDRSDGGLLAAAFLAKNPGARIIHDPRLTWNTVDLVTSLGGVPFPTPYWRRTRTTGSHGRSIWERPTASGSIATSPATCRTPTPIPVNSPSALAALPN